jgi:hypothetical protein
MEAERVTIIKKDAKLRRRGKDEGMAHATYIFWRSC